MVVGLSHLRAQCVGDGRARWLGVLVSKPWRGAYLWLCCERPSLPCGRPITNDRADDSKLTLISPNGNQRQMGFIYLRRRNRKLVTGPFWEIRGDLGSLLLDRSDPAFAQLLS